MCIYTICKIPKYFAYFQCTQNQANFGLGRFWSKKTYHLKFPQWFPLFGQLKSRNAKNVHFPGSFLSSYMYNVLHTCSKQYVSLDNQWNLLNDFRFCVCYTFSHWNQSYSYIAKGKFFRGACGSMTGLQNYCLLIFVLFSALEYQNNWMSSHFQAISR